jgi:hypothetical protein
VDRVVPNAMSNNAPLRGGRINIVFGEADPPKIDIRESPPRLLLEKLLAPGWASRN